MLEESMMWLGLKKGGVWVDATAGGGGHSEAILERSAPDGVLIGIDQDAESVTEAQKRLGRFGERALVVRGNFRDIGRILADLGTSMRQLASGARGFSFNSDETLDMRMSGEIEKSAYDLVNRASEAELRTILIEYGEERRGARVAAAIATERKHAAIRTCSELARIVRRAVGKGAKGLRIDPATRSFQALRIAVNDELGSLSKFLSESTGLLQPGGRLVVISYHSLEDRIVKQYFKAASGGGAASMKILTKKPAVPGRNEIRMNRRARSAKLRAAEKLELCAA